MAQISLTGNWTGRYDYANPAHGEPVPFDAILTESSGTLRGETLEPNSFRPEPTDSLMAVLAGTRSGSLVHFVKTYTDFETEDRPTYEGTVNASATRINGRWFFPAMPLVCGTFLLARASRAAVRTRAEESAVFEL